MKRLLIIILILLSLTRVNAQQQERFSYSTTVGYGWDLNTPSYHPFGVQFTVMYTLNSHFGIGCETGINKYENLVIPLCLVGEYKFREAGKVIPFIDTSFGYGFTLCRYANGGMQLTPSLGALYRLNDKLNLYASLFYQTQRLERLKDYANDLFHAEFQERLTHNVFGLRLGIVFKQ